MVYFMWYLTGLNLLTSRMYYGPKELVFFIKIYKRFMLGILKRELEQLMIRIWFPTLQGKVA